jgi:hypothetical protein
VNWQRLLGWTLMAGLTALASAACRCGVRFVMRREQNTTQRKPQRLLSRDRTATVLFCFCAAPPHFFSR